MKRILKPLFLLCIAACSLSAQAQYIHLFAGDHTSGYAGDNAAATAAECFAPAGITVDTAGNVYFADQGNSVIRKVSTSGVITTIAGTGTAGYSGDGGPATAAMLGEPTSVLADDSGNILFTDDDNDIVRKIDPTGTITTIAGIPNFPGYFGDGSIPTDAVLNSPSGLALDKFGNLFIADMNNQCIRKVLASSGIIITYAGIPDSISSNDSTGHYQMGNRGYAGTATFAFPSGLAVDTNGNLYIADKGNSEIRKVYAATSFIACLAGDTVVFLGTPEFGYNGDGILATHAYLYTPTQVAVGADNAIYIADYGNHRVRKVTPDGTIYTMAGNGTSGYSGLDGPAPLAELAAPFGVAINNRNNKVYITDNINNVVLVTDATAGVTTIPMILSLDVYPNPSTGTFKVGIPGAVQSGTIVLTDITGHVVATRNFTNTSAQKQDFTIEDVAPGTYLLTVNAGNAQYHSKVSVY